MHAAQVVFYDPKTGRELQAFDHSGDDGARNFACAAVNPAGDAAVVGAYNRLYVFAKSGPKGTWQAAGVKQVGGSRLGCRWVCSSKALCNCAGICTRTYGASQSGLCLPRSTTCCPRQLLRGSRMGPSWRLAR